MSGGDPGFPGNGCTQSSAPLTNAALSDITCKIKLKWYPKCSEDNRFPSEIQRYKNTHTGFRFWNLQFQSQSLLENLFVAVSFNSAAGTDNKWLNGKHCSLIIEVYILQIRSLSSIVLSAIYKNVFRIVTYIRGRPICVFQGRDRLLQIK